MQRAIQKSTRTRSLSTQDRDKSERGNPTISRKEDYRRLAKIVKSNRGKSSALIRVLHEVQNDLGHIPPWVQQFLAGEMRIPYSEIHGVVTFYNFFSQYPKGRHTVQVCQGTACYVRGGKRIMEVLVRKLGIKAGETTVDGRFSLEVVRCLGCCGLAPVITVSGDMYRRTNPKKATEILVNYR